MNIPQALINLKKGSGDFWPDVRKVLVDYLDFKRELYKSNLSIKRKKEIEKLKFKNVVEYVSSYPFHGIVESGRQIPMHENQIISHLINVLTTFRKTDYNSKVMCFVKDSYNISLKSGNKKYPNL